MGCCEYRDWKSDYIPTQKGIRRLPYQATQKPKYSQLTQEFLRKQVTFTFPQLSGQLPHSLSKKVPELQQKDPLFEYIQKIQRALSHQWKQEIEKDWMQQKYFNDLNLGQLVYFQINFRRKIKNEVILRVMNSTKNRVMWDNNIIEFTLVKGHDILDSDVQVLFRQSTEPICMKRFVRQYRKQLLQISWIGQKFQETSEFMSMYYQQSAGDSMVEIVIKKNEDLDEVLKSTRVWAAKFYQEVLYNLSV